MTIGTPTTLGSANSNTANNLTITTTAAIVAGNLVTVALTYNTTGTQPTTTSVSDGTNSYTKAEGNTSQKDTTEIWRVENAQAVGSGASLKVALSGNAQAILMCAAKVSGIAASSALDSAHANNTGASSQPTVTTGTLGSTQEIVFAANGINTQGGASETFTEDSGNGFSTLYSFQNGNQFGALSLSYKIVSSGAAVTHSPTWTGTPSAWVAVATPFKAPPTAAPAWITLDESHSALIAAQLKPFPVAY
jgi:hypothetical protein